ncbi:hypothetical protein EYF80_013543 [Liparis tanakae]|uniref:Uncharacterized protein n=1 Tax=Liparis tanakae TaxID=230148 RepID=A0A4Z2IF92_9TELE|nr:hypothetical protein EYF80_013543 [Liparis tanakae]
MMIRDEKERGEDELQAPGHSSSWFRGIPETLNYRACGGGGGGWQRVEMPSAATWLRGVPAQAFRHASADNRGPISTATLERRIRG